MSYPFWRYPGAQSWSASWKRLPAEPDTPTEEDVSDLYQPGKRHKHFRRTITMQKKEKQQHLYYCNG